jgi:5-methylcytosine-specific restriction enzyme subunit McrC
VRQAERLVRQGLRTAYVEHEDALPVLRGRLLFERQMRRRYGRLDRLECRYDERSGDIFDNQLVLAAVQRCAARAAHVGIRRRAGRVQTRLREVCDARHIALPRRPGQYDRLNAHYRPAHELSWLVLEGTQGLDDLYESGDTPSFAFLLNMNTLFETFVERVLEASLRERSVQLSFQKPSGSVVRRADTGSPYQRLIPDTLARVGVPSVTVPIDAKYKRYSERKVDPGDIAQMFIYASGLGTAPEHERPHGIIIYPSETREFERIPLTVRDPHDTALSKLDVLGIPIAAAIDEATAAVEARPILDALAEVVLSAANTP